MFLLGLDRQAIVTMLGLDGYVSPDGILIGRHNTGHKKYFVKHLSFIIAFCLLLSFTGQGQSCKDLPDKFYSYNQAINAIQNANFKTTDNLQYGKSSWITSANYYSCDGYTGYLVYTTDKGKEYVHEKVPIKVWSEFKTASSSGSYYVHNIKGRYRLVPE
jgi:hypothetical protein